MKTIQFKTINNNKTKKKEENRKKLFCASLESAQKNDCTESLVCYTHLSTATILMSGKTEEEQACKAK